MKVSNILKCNKKHVPNLNREVDQDYAMYRNLITYADRKILWVKITNILRNVWEWRLYINRMKSWQRDKDEYKWVKQPNMVLI